MDMAVAVRHKQAGVNLNLTTGVLRAKFALGRFRAGRGGGGAGGSGKGGGAGGTEGGEEAKDGDHLRVQTMVAGTVLGRQHSA